MVHLPEQEAMQINEIARNVDRGDLPGAFRLQLVANCKAIDEDSAYPGPIALTDDILAGPELLGVSDGIQQNATFLVGQAVVLAKVLNQWMDDERSLRRGGP
jgi:hypothetical protein